MFSYPFLSRFNLMFFFSKLFKFKVAEKVQWTADCVHLNLIKNVVQHLNTLFSIYSEPQQFSVCAPQLIKVNREHINNFPNFEAN